MKTYEIECEGEIHHIGIDDEGHLHALDHDEEERIAVELGDKPSRCLEIILAIEDYANAEKLTKRVKIRLGRLMDIISEEAIGGNTGAVSLLLDAGAPYDNALRLAIDRGHVDVVDVILKKEKYNDKTKNSASYRQYVDRAFVQAANKGQLGLVKYLVEVAGSEGPYYDDGAIVAAAEHNHSDVVSYILSISYDNAPIYEPELKNAIEFAESALYYAHGKSEKILKEWLTEHGE